MSSSAISIVIKMMESLPPAIQDQVAEHLQEYILDLQDEARWEESFQKAESNLIAAARRAKQQIAQGQSSPLDYDQL